jgi:hypothetical protein
MTDMGNVSPSVDYANRKFIARDGTELTLRPLPKLILERLYNNTDGKPKPPIIEVEIAGQFKRMESNPNDPAFLARLQEWESAKNLRLLKFVAVEGVVELPPADFIRHYSEYFPEETEQGMKYLWVVGLLGADGEDIPLFMEALTSQTAVTEKGLETASETFPGDGRGL